MVDKTLYLKIVTEDKKLLTGLLSAQIPDIEISWKQQTCDSLDWIPSEIRFTTIIITSVSSIGLSMLAMWLYDHIVKKNPGKTTIHNIKIVNRGQIINIINNYSSKISQRNNKNKKQN